MTKRIVQDDMYRMAKDFKRYFEDNAKPPYRLAYHNIEYFTKDMTYIFCYGLFHLKNNFNVVEADWCNNADGVKIKEKISIEDYKQQAKDVYNYILKNKKVPDNVVTKQSNKKVNIDLFTYCLAKVLVYYRQHGQLPLTCEYNSRVLEVPTASLDTLGNIAKTAKEYVEKNYALLSEIDGFRHGEYTYLFAKVIANYGNLIDRKGVRTATNPQGDNINMKIYKTHYINLAKNLIDFVDKNNKLPDYLSIEGKKIKANLYEFAFAKILNYYYINGELPAYVVVDSNAFVKPQPKPVITKYGHATQSGCDARGQNNGVYCAPHSMQEVIRNLTGKVIPQSTLASWAGTTSAGTGHWGIESAIAKAAKYLGVNLSCRWYNFSELGWEGINKILNSNNQDCIIHNLYRYNPGVYDGDGHYEVINSISGNTVKVQNSLGDRCSGGCYCGYVENRSKSTFQTYISGISQKSVCVITRS